MKHFLYILIFFFLTPSALLAQEYFINDSQIETLFNVADEISYSEYIVESDTLKKRSNNGKIDFITGFLPTFLAGGIAFSMGYFNSANENVNNLPETILTVSLISLSVAMVFGFCFIILSEKSASKLGAGIAISPFCIGFAGSLIYYMGNLQTQF